MIFSERYKELIDVGHGEAKDNICGEIKFNIKKKIAEVLVEFAEPQKYQVSRYNNLEEKTTALEFGEKGSYAEAISNAEKSYESVLKILCNVNRGNADKLTKQVLETNICNIPESMTTEGFREKVLLSLPYVRNNSTASHGSGKEVVEITKEMASLSINMAAALNTYLIESYVRNGFSEKEDE